MKGKIKKEKGKNGNRTFAFYLFAFAFEEPPEHCNRLGEIGD
jgi:hypothetical protein